MINKKLTQKAVIIFSLLFIFGLQPIYAMMLNSHEFGRMLITYLLVTFIFAALLKGILSGLLKEKGSIVKIGRFIILQILEFIGILVVAFHPWPLSLHLLIGYFIAFSILNIFLIKGKKHILLKDIFSLKNFSKGFLLSLAVPVTFALNIAISLK